MVLAVDYLNLPSRMFTIVISKKAWGAVPGRPGVFTEQAPDHVRGKGAGWTDARTLHDQE